jgi:hypothetical protein
MKSGFRGFGKVPASGFEGGAVSPGRSPETLAGPAEGLPPVKDLRQERDEQGAKGHDKYCQGGDVVRQMLEMHPEKLFLFPCPLQPGVSRLHEQAHEAGYLFGFVEKECLMICSHSVELVLYRIDHGTHHVVLSPPSGV